MHQKLLVAGPDEASAAYMGELLEKAARAARLSISGS